MNCRTWCTKEDALMDLEVVSGQKVTDVDKNCFVIGDRPPPPRLHKDDYGEMELLFGRDVSRAINNNSPKETAPDLKGITQMLRMVQHYENSATEEEKITPVANKANVLVISKLNPNVKEFIPKMVSNKNGTITNSIASKSSTRTRTCDSNTDKLDKASAAIKTEIGVVEATSDKENKAQMVAMLKNKISTKFDTYEQRREANFAIVNLLKLYAKPEPKPTPAKPTPSKSLKLYTPDFFKNCNASDFKTNLEDSSNNTDCSFEQVTSIPNVDEVKTNDRPVDKSESNSRINYSNIIVNDDNQFDEITKHTLLTPAMADNTIRNNFGMPSVVVDKTDRYVAESINKVNNWFDNKPSVKKEKPKGSVLYLGTVCYKRKDPVTCKSPSEAAEKKILKPSEATYQPSKYAEELLKKYKERSKEITPPLNIWEKLERDLKNKDAEMRKQSSRGFPPRGRKL